ncbi:hypothetical protein [Hymenobacter metallicola]|uniref:Uncharacterized protein n=1 Tax=Hymenobacter metallicola TaxID=2563114 RepID=A0A4Z0QBG3_9BACT|nr:hypothetical protein [Hymenobacter metallicola]TGE27370.1 hypothetical protein E5K02_13385 [Hymenobacter metallicola]
MKNRIVLAVAAASLLAVSCQKTDLAPSATPGSNLVAKAPAVAPGCDVIDFERYSGFTGFGGLLSSVTSAGNAGPIAMTSYNANYPSQPVAAIVFESSSTTPPGPSSQSYGGWDPFQNAAEDLDLGTPNELYGGYGRGAGGAATNKVPLGNILVIQDFIWGQPNDDDGRGYVTFDFSTMGAITASGLTIIDAETLAPPQGENEGGSVELWTANPMAGGTLLTTVPFVNTGSNGVARLSLGNTPNVGFIRVNIIGSIGIDNLEFCRPQPLHCNYTQGYWKNHPESWPVSSLTIGTANPLKSYTKAQLLDVLKTPVKGNGLIALAHQLIAAKLNVALDNDPAIQTTIAQADALIGNRSLFGGTLTTAQTSALVTALDAYNNSNHCN